MYILVCVGSGIWFGFLKQFEFVILVYICSKHSWFKFIKRGKHEAYRFHKPLD